MFEFTNNYGGVISEHSPNIVLAASVLLGASNFVGGTGGIYGGEVQIVFDFALPSVVNVPIVGITLHSRIGYNCFSYLDRNKQKRVRIWLGFERAHLSQLDNRGRLNEAQIVEKLGITARLYDAQPPQAKGRCGLQVFDAAGKVIFDSNYNPMKVGKRANIDDGKHLIFPKCFLFAGWLSGENQLWQVVESVKPAYLWRWNGTRFMDLSTFDGFGVGNQSWHRFYLEQTERDEMQPLIGYL